MKMTEERRRGKQKMAEMTAVPEIIPGEPAEMKAEGHKEAERRAVRTRIKMEIPEAEAAEMREIIPAAIRKKAARVQWRAEAQILVKILEAAEIPEAEEIRKAAEIRKTAERIRIPVEKIRNQ